MKRRSDTPRRSEITEKVDKHHEDMNEKGEEIEKDVEDVKTVRETLDSIEGGTQEGLDAESQAIEAAEDTGIGEFDEDRSELEDVHNESEEHESEINDRGDTVSSDLGKISDASGRINNDAVSSELIDAKSEAIRDKEFLDEQEDRAKDAREDSRRLLEKHQAEIDSGRSS